PHRRLGRSAAALVGYLCVDAEFLALEDEVDRLVNGAALISSGYLDLFGVVVAFLRSPLFEPFVWPVARNPCDGWHTDDLGDASCCVGDWFEVMPFVGACDRNDPSFCINSFDDFLHTVLLL